MDFDLGGMEQDEEEAVEDEKMEDEDGHQEEDSNFDVNSLKTPGSDDSTAAVTFPRTALSDPATSISRHSITLRKRTEGKRWSNRSTTEGVGQGGEANQRQRVPVGATHTICLSAGSSSSRFFGLERERDNIIWIRD